MTKKKCCQIPWKQRCYGHWPHGNCWQQIPIIPVTANIVANQTLWLLKLVIVRDCMGE